MQCETWYHYVVQIMEEISRNTCCRVEESFEFGALKEGEGGRVEAITHKYE